LRNQTADILESGLLGKNGCLFVGLIDSFDLTASEFGDEMKVYKEAVLTYFNVEDEVFSVRTIKTCKGRESIDPLILHLGTG
jgi:hypothetical protein